MSNPSLDAMIKAAVSNAYEEEEQTKTASVESTETAVDGEVTETTETEKVASADLIKLAEDLEAVGEALEDPKARALDAVLSKLGEQGSKQVLQSETNIGAMLKGKEPKKDAASAQPPMKPAIITPANSSSATALETTETQPTEKTKQKDTIMKTSGKDILLQKILEKRAGEEGSPASITAPKAARNPEDEAAPAQPQQGDRAMISSSEAVIKFTKGEAKSTPKKVMKDVLTEPALAKKHDSKLHENLDNASSAGVKISQVREELKKVAAQGCTCGTGLLGSCEHCRLTASVQHMTEKRAAAQKVRNGVQKALDKRGFFGGGASGGVPTPATPAVAAGL